MTVKAKKTQLKTKSEIEIKTVSQLKFWLNGIKEFQSDSWVPDSKQWKKIYDTIMGMDESQPLDNQHVMHHTQVQNDNSSQHPRMMPPPTLYDHSQQAVMPQMPPSDAAVLEEANLPLSVIKERFHQRSLVAPSPPANYNLLGNGQLVNASETGFKSPLA